MALPPFHLQQQQQQQQHSAPPMSVGNSTSLDVPAPPGVGPLVAASSASLSASNYPDVAPPGIATLVQHPPPHPHQHPPPHSHLPPPNHPHLVRLPFSLVGVPVPPEVFALYAAGARAMAPSTAPFLLSASAAFHCQADARVSQTFFKFLLDMTWFLRRFSKV